MSDSAAGASPVAAMASLSRHDAGLAGKPAHAPADLSNHGHVAASPLLLCCSVDGSGSASSRIALPSRDQTVSQCRRLECQGSPRGSRVRQSLWRSPGMAPAALMTTPVTSPWLMGGPWRNAQIRSTSWSRSVWKRGTRSRQSAPACYVLAGNRAQTSWITRKPVSRPRRSTDSTWSP